VPKAACCVQVGTIKSMEDSFRHSMTALCDGHVNGASSMGFEVTKQVSRLFQRDRWPRLARKAGGA
jgi:hypothetical protein